MAHPHPRRRNPITIGKHPSLFGGETPVLIDWRTMSPAEVERAVARGDMPAEDWNDMVDASELSEASLVRDGVNPELARALADDFMEHLEEVDELGREERIKPLVEAIRQQALAEIEHATESYGRETYVDIFQEQLPATVRRLSREMLKALKEDGDYRTDDVTIDMMEQVMSDPDIYELSISKDGYARIPPGSAAINIGTTESSVVIPVDLYANLSDADVVAAVKELEDRTPFIRFQRTPKTASDFSPKQHTGRLDFNRAGELVLDSVREITISETDDWRCVFSPKLDAVIAALDEITGASTKVTEPYEVAYRYAGSNSTVAGASAKGMYVAKLLPSQLKRIGAALGICVGREDMGYRRRLSEGAIELYAILTEADKPKFCIERNVRDNRIVQVKGKANRLPGFAADDLAMTKPDEVRLVVEFLQSLGYSDADIAAAQDIGPGVFAMIENGVIPFVPPPVKQRRLKENPALIPSAATAAMVREDYARPWGGRWGT